MRVLFVGCGKQGRLLFDILEKSVKGEFHILSKNKKPFCANSVTEMSELDPIAFDLIVFTVKPQQIHKILEQFKAHQFHKKTVFVSILAGIKSQVFTETFGEFAKVVRVMPNLAISTGEGLMSVFLNEHAQDRREWIETKLQAGGRVYFVQKEADLDKMTILGGSMPGFAYFMAEVLEGVCADYFKDFDRELLTQVLLGSFKYAKTENKPFAELYEAVASKGGVTEAGLEVLKAKKEKLAEIFKKTLESSNQRMLDLSKIVD
jgi:pyrroline-5-carboxylate reductase